MRISDEERRVIVSAVKKKDATAEVWLFGSRADSLLKGGDIDLLIISDNIGFSEKIDILVEIKMRIGEQKIDLTIVKRAERETDPLASKVLKNSIRL